MVIAKCMTLLKGIRDSERWFWNWELIYVDDFGCRVGEQRATFRHTPSGKIVHTFTR